jgi:two-component system chemotaxis response regulator CheB
VQHITSSFLAGFVAWLDDMCSFKVCIAQDGEPALPGHVYLPPMERHLEFGGRRLRTVDGPLVSNQKPSGTVLFRSLAQNLGSHTLAVLLTGMGDDGAEGLRAIRDAGGYTIAEDESTAVVYGMPAVAVRLGAVTEQLPLHRIGARIREISRLKQVAV